MDRDDPAYKGQAGYTPFLLAIYDPFVLGFMAGAVWRCPTPPVVERYRKHLGSRHLDVGPGTGYFIEKAAPPAGTEITLLDPNPNVLGRCSRRLAGMHPTTVEADVMKPLPVDGPFDSAALNFVLHCLRGPQSHKAVAIPNVAAVLKPGWTGPGKFPQVEGGGEPDRRGPADLVDWLERRPCVPLTTCVWECPRDVGSFPGWAYWRLVMSALSFRRLAAIWALVLSGALIIVGVFVDPDIGAEGRELARKYAENPVRIQISAHSLRLGFALQIVPTFVLISIVRARGAWLANTAGILAVLGMTTLPGLLIVDFYDVAIYGELGSDAWQAVSDRLEELPGTIIMFLSAFVAFALALPLSLAAAWRAGLLSWWPGLLALAGTIAAQVVPGGIGLLIWSGVLVVLGFVLWRLFQSRPLGVSQTE